MVTGSGQNKESMATFSGKDLALAGALALAYFVSAKFGLLLSLAGNSVTLFWPPSGIALTMLLVFGMRLWPGVFVGSVFGNLAAGMAPALEISLGSTLEAMAGAWLLRNHILPFNLSLGSIRDIFTLLLVGAGAALLSALNGPFWLAHNGLLPLADYPGAVIYWWMGDMLGVVLFAPPLLAWLRHKPLPNTAAIRREAMLYFAMLALLSLMVFSNYLHNLLDMHIGSFVLLPVLVWGALRFNMRTSTLGSVIVFFASVAGMAWGMGEFSPVSLHSVREVWGYNLIMAMTCLVLVVYNYQRERTSKFLELSEANLRHAQSVAAIGSWRIDIAGDELTCSDETCRIFGLAPGTSMTLNAFVERVHPADRDMLLESWRAALKGEPYDIEHRVLVNGQVRWVRERAEFKYTTAGWALSASGTVQDITERKEAEESIRFLAYYDVLTGLPNRTLFHDRIGQTLIAAQREEGKFAVLFLDLDRFKYINDSMGHMAGDKLLQAVAQRLRASVRETDTVSRLGGDEFIILLRETDIDGAAYVAEKILAAVSASFEINGVTVTPQGSIGISMYPEDGEDVNTLVKHADAAMYHAKDLGRNNYQFFTEQMNVRAQFYFDMEKDLRQALERNEFELYYQPQISLRDHRLTGLEALLRWHHPQRGMVPPAEFIPVAEESGLIVPIGAWVLRTAAAQARAWRSRGLVNVPLAVNLSIRQLQDRNLIVQLAEFLKQPDPSGWMLELELTESIMLNDANAAMKFIAEARQMGVQFSIDDFGTGYSSMSYLKKLSLDRLKIDQSFVRDLHIDPEDAAIVRSIISLAHGLSLKVIAEGVETAEQVNFLRAAGCDEAQGYYICRPRPAAELEEFLRQAQVKAIQAADTSNAGALPDIAEA
jgi:diguanylate cyclase (GGDEF)-like protein/PAS domain S-box-containing protein